jgi:hypothetical protein
MGAVPFLKKLDLIWHKIGEGLPKNYIGYSEMRIYAHQRKSMFNSPALSLPSCSVLNNQWRSHMLVELIDHRPLGK